MLHVAKSVAEQHAGLQTADLALHNEPLANSERAVGGDKNNVYSFNKKGICHDQQ